MSDKILKMGNCPCCKICKICGCYVQKWDIITYYDQPDGKIEEIFCQKCGMDLFEKPLK